MKELKNKLLTEIDPEDVPSNLRKYYDISIAFQKLFITNLENVHARTNQVKKAKGNWINDIKLMMEQDEVTVEELKEVWTFLKGHTFWSKNILSTDKLRKQFDKLHAQLKTEQNGQQTNSNQGQFTADRIQATKDRLRAKFG